MFCVVLCFIVKVSCPVILHNVLIRGGLCSIDRVLIRGGFCIDISVLLQSLCCSLCVCFFLCVYFVFNV